MEGTENKQVTQQTEEPPKKQEPEQEPTAPSPDPLSQILALVTQQSADIAALGQRVSALQNQQAVESSIVHEANGGRGIPTSTEASGQSEEEDEDYPEIDLEEISRMIGDY